MRVRTEKKIGGKRKRREEKGRGKKKKGRDRLGGPNRNTIWAK